LPLKLPQIIADRVQLQQVFMNLMLNAIEAMKDSGGELTVKSELQDGQLQFSVSDTGVGLPAEKMDQIFSAFFTTKPQGSGMGLASAVPLWSRMAGSCGQAPTVEGAQLFISPYRSRSRSHHLWLLRFLELGVLGFGLSIDGKIGVGAFPNAKEFFVRFTGGCVVAHHLLRAAELEPGQGSDDMSHAKTGIVPVNCRSVGGQISEMSSQMPTSGQRR
jgi:Histidine kinase-, DNA gyrase B-, and HSP90-like ATPase